VRLFDPVAGRVAIDGVDVRDLARGVLAEHVALVPQQAFLFVDTVRGNVTRGADVSDDEVWQALRVAQADGFVAALPEGIDTRLGERGASLSGGQRQRLSLARAVVRHPRLLVMDDATSAVDPEVEARILAALRRVSGDAAGGGPGGPDGPDGTAAAPAGADAGGAGPTTVLVVAYRKATIALADEVVFLAGGRIVDQGAHADLLARNPAYAELVNAYDTDTETGTGAGAADGAEEATLR
jgi:ABC-type multidrug transport system fused ATPase/permease subunit